MRSLKTTAKRRPPGPASRRRQPTAGQPSPPGSADPAAPSSPAMKLTEVLGELEAACKQLGIKLTYEAIGGELGAGGLCKVKGQWRAIFDKRTTPSERVGLLAPILTRFPLATVSLSPPVRELLGRVLPSPVQPPPVDSAAPAVGAGL